ncbi:MAG TPA: NAD(P)-dependent oxidoreductase [Paracoccaceae bacterium]|nr:NAD(P)-dependent oxidoreductase [Paracoccaceae bacterium]
MILVDVDDEAWIEGAAFKARLEAALPGEAVALFADGFDSGRVEMLVCSRLRPGLAARLPRLRLVQKLGAGVETMLTGELPEGVRLARVRSDAQALEMTEFALAAVLGDRRRLAHFAGRQRARVWAPEAPPEGPGALTVLGLGTVGARIAAAFAALEWRVTGWSRSAKALPGVECLSGEAGLATALGAAGHVVAVLPSTPGTRGLMGARRFAAMRPGALFVNLGRGDLVDEAALLAALDAGRPGRALLDVTATEPLPPDSPLWTHSAVTVTPHVSGWHVGDALADVAENRRRLAAGGPLIGEVDRRRGY